MKIEEYNKLNAGRLNTHDWMHVGIGVIKKYHRKSRIIPNNEYFVFGNVRRILPDMTETDAIRLKTLGWEIKEFNGKSYFCYKNNTYD